MLHRAASNAYSWWWASHIKTKQSKWLEQNLQDMEEKVKYMLKLIEEDGDSFAKRAEMYYRKRPELINFVEESYRAYRALAERYEHISAELQNANTTIATVFPEQVQLALDEEDENDSPEITTRPFDPSKGPKGLPETPNPNIPKVPNIAKKDSKGLPTVPKKKVQSRKSTNATNFQKSKAEALQDIDKLQKGILALQTEKEFVKGSYESGLVRYWEIEKRITEMQEEVCSLQDEFNVGMVIEDDEARTLMVATALKSCQETLIHLQEKQERSAEEARLEHQRIKDAHKKLEILKNEFLHSRTDQQKNSDKEPTVEDPTSKDVEQEICSLKQERLELESLHEKIRKHFETNSGTSLTATELAEKCDELVVKVICLETAVSSQTILIKRLRSETNELHAKLQCLEDDKETLIKGSNNLNEKLKELEEELHRIQDLNRNVEDQNNSLQMHFTEAHCNFKNLWKNLQCVKQLEEVETTDSFDAEVDVTLNVESHKESKEPEEVGTPFVELVTSTDKITEIEGDRGITPCVNDQEEGFVHSQRNSNLDDYSKNCQELRKQDAVEKQDSSQTEDGDHVESQKQTKDQEDEPNWQQLFLNGLEDKEKILLAEYTSILRNYKEAKKKLSEAEKNNRVSLFETTVQIRELKSANAQKDEEIQSLHQKLNLLQTSCNENSDMHLTEFEDSKMGKLSDEMVEGLISQSPNVQMVNSNEKQVFNMSDDRNVEATASPDKSTVMGAAETPPTKEEPNVILADEPDAVSSIEEKLRRDIDELLEENLEFWLRFSTSFQHIQKFQSTVQDLKREYSRLMENKKQQESTTTDHTLRSDARLIYKHLREIQTELTLWMEQNALLKDELQCRFSSLCKIQEEIARVLKDSSETDEFEFTSYQAAKFQGEILNMQQENNKVADELQAGLDHVRGFQFEIETTLSKLNEDFKVSGSKNHHHEMKHSMSRNGIPLRSFIFGTKQKKQKPKIIFCMNPALHKRYRDLQGGFPM